MLTYLISNPVSIWEVDLKHAHMFYVMCKSEKTGVFIKPKLIKLILFGKLYLN